MDDVSERSAKKITPDHLRHLADIAKQAFDALTTNPYAKSRIYDGRLLMLCLCQGGAIHYLDGKNGVKDLDVWGFFAAHPDMRFPPRNRWIRDFGASDLGRHPEDAGFVGRRIDIMGRSIEVRDGDSPTQAVTRWFTEHPTGSAWVLGQKPAIAIYPEPLAGTVIWPGRDAS